MVCGQATPNPSSGIVDTFLRFAKILFDSFSILPSFKFFNPFISLSLYFFLTGNLYACVEGKGKKEVMTYNLTNHHSFPFPKISSLLLVIVTFNHHHHCGPKLLSLLLRLMHPLVFTTCCYKESCSLSRLSPTPPTITSQH